MRVWRIRKELSQGEMADRLGVSQKRLSQIECGSGVPGRDLAVRIEDMTGIAVREWSASEDEVSEPKAVSR